ncbi:MAPEG family protein [Algiphilus sp. NNCM1]|uniref:MAPEG family protein n=1 Tax=Algiphilus sp. TaxID=1872431 RepID=UPI001CA784B5|nr:MAPEG family protein [Algiphilus sp.]MBY8965458.1 MAPEG family protein [Algiphilus acroporae]MCI5063981.1 MAPEG family protein [Algiphilus sp.]MCI5104904.1 MAPEG family protein [Algiphilus sp.]
MTPSLTAVALFAGWALLLVFIPVGYRVVAVLTKGKAANSWTRGHQQESEPGLVERAGHAHLNTLENLPVFAALVLAGVASGQGAAIDALAPWVLYARMAQSVVHLIGVNHWLVLVRAGFFAAQLILFLVMLFRLL